MSMAYCLIYLTVLMKLSFSNSCHMKLASIESQFNIIDFIVFLKNYDCLILSDAVSCDLVTDCLFIFM